MYCEGDAVAAGVHVAAGDPLRAGSHADLVALSVVAHHLADGEGAVTVGIDRRGRVLAGGVVPVVIVIRPAGRSSRDSGSSARDGPTALRYRRRRQPGLRRGSPSAQTSGALTFCTFHSMPWAGRWCPFQRDGQSGAHVGIGVDMGDVGARGQRFHQVAVAA